MTTIDGSDLGSRYGRDRAPKTAGPQIGAQAKQEPATRFWAILCAVFMVSLVIPLVINVGPFRMSPYRFILVLAFLPMVGSWLSGGCGRIVVTDILMLCFALWSFVTQLVNHGSGVISFAGMFTVETFGGYLMARHAIRNVDDLTRVARLFFLIVLALVPFAIAEAVTMQPWLLKVFGPFGRTIANAGSDVRLGLRRAQVAFEHPILYGVFVSTTFSLLYYTPRKNKPGVAGIRRAWASVVATFCSISSGAFIPVVFQVGLMMWNGILRILPWRWWLFLGMCVAAYIAVDLISDRNPFRVFAARLSFNQANSFWRVLIFNFGIQNVWANPIFGFGMGTDWVRPHWMVTATIDNLWLVIAMRHGIPGFLLFAGAYLAATLRMALVKTNSETENNYRYALVFTLASTAIAISTVWLWNATWVHLMFLLGAGAWLSEPRTLAVGQGATPANDNGAPGGETEEKLPRTRYARTHRPAAPKTAATSARPAKAPREKVRYSRVEPRAAQNNRDKGDPDKRH